ncbi:MAG: RluA family pseudouridine synthase [bacterium]|jgi:23S rRNA pseudouridine1911/1915/1917 synthase|nr:RluA family pseudouridine synthase [Planctomycetota bacterium]HIL51414.1 RluA family pseudouridine synthase [Planctomycetota bacterium]
MDASALAVEHCDNHVIVVHKPAGVPVVPDSSGDASLLDAAKAWVGREYNKPGAVFLGVVSRLDRPVSGLVIFARTSKAAARLTEQFRTGSVQKTYWGIVAREPLLPAGELEQFLVKDRERNTVEVVASGVAGARSARTAHRILASSAGCWLLELVPHTGRSHQLRLACARGLGAPLLGDLKYGAPVPLSDKSIALHARALAFDHPTRDERLSFRAAPPPLKEWSLARG